MRFGGTWLPPTSAKPHISINLSINLLISFSPLFDVLPCFYRFDLLYNLYNNLYVVARSALWTNIRRGKLTLHYIKAMTFFGMIATMLNNKVMLNNRCHYFIVQHCAVAIILKNVIALLDVKRVHFL